MKAARVENPICPDCRAVMVKAEEQNEEGDWGVRWLCECKVESPPKELVLNDE